MPAQRRVPIEAGGEARLMLGELMRRTKVRRVERGTDATMLPPTEDWDGQQAAIREETIRLFGKEMSQGRDS